MKQQLAWLGLLLAFSQPSEAAAADSAAKPTGSFVHSVPISMPAPPFPPSAVRQRHEGIVKLRIKVGANGEPAEASIEKSSGFDELDAAALRAVAGWRYRPATQDGKNVEETILVPLTFSFHTNDPPSLEGPSPAFRCAFASTPTEKAICSDSELVALEGGMDAAYRHRNYVTAPAQAPSLVKEQDAFLRERAKRCGADVPCLKQMTTARLWQLPWNPTK